tara:strand:+ start:6510 stop:7109 length:600 start_codon:yes stop_codon:yes gene_type:complete
MSDAEIDIAMPENPEPGEQPEDPLEDEEYEGVDDPEPKEETEEAEAQVELEVKEIVPDQEVFLDAPKQAPPKKQRARKPPSEKQLAHLAKIRVKAVEAKRAKNAAKKSIKAEVSEVPQKKSIKAKEVPVDAEGGLVHLTQEQLRQLQYEAIYGYDTMRKERKTKKKAAEAKDKQEKQVYAAVSKAINPSADDGWGVCFQ